MRFFLAMFAWSAFCAFSPDDAVECVLHEVSGEVCSVRTVNGEIYSVGSDESARMQRGAALFERDLGEPHEVALVDVGGGVRDGSTLKCTVKRAALYPMDCVKSVTQSALSFAKKLCGDGAAYTTLSKDKIFFENHDIGQNLFFLDDKTVCWDDVLKEKTKVCFVQSLGCNDDAMKGVLRFLASWKKDVVVVSAFWQELSHAGGGDFWGQVPYAGGDDFWGQVPCVKAAVRVESVPSDVQVILLGCAGNRGQDIVDMLSLEAKPLQASQASSLYMRARPQNDGIVFLRAAGIILGVIYCIYFLQSCQC